MSLGEASFALAVHCHQAGQVPQTVALYQEILRRSPQHAGAWHLLGVVGQDHAGALSNSATLLQELGRDAEDFPLLRRGQRLQSTHADTLHKLGGLDRDQGPTREAIDGYRPLLKSRSHTAAPVRRSTRHGGDTISGIYRSCARH